MVSVLEAMEEEGVDTNVLMHQMHDIIIKTIITVQPSLSHVYKSCQPDDVENNKCFEVLGFDIMIDEDAKPWLLEVNASPSFATESPMDYDVKLALISDSLKLLNLSVKRK